MFPLVKSLDLLGHGGWKKIKHVHQMVVKNCDFPWYKEKIKKHKNKKQIQEKHVDHHIHKTLQCVLGRPSEFG